MNLISIEVFRDDETYYGKSKEEKLIEWSRKVDSKDIISISKSEKEITVFIRL